LHPIDAIAFVPEIIVAQFVTCVLHDQQKSRHTNDKAQYVDGGENTIPGNIPPYRDEVVSNHDQCISNDYSPTTKWLPESYNHSKSLI